MSEFSVLIVDDEEQLLEIMTWELEDLGCKVYTALNIEEAKKIIEEQEIHMIFSDFNMPGGSGIDLANDLKAKGKEIPFVLVTGYVDGGSKNLDTKDLFSTLIKPIDMTKLQSLVESVKGK